MQLHRNWTIDMLWEETTETNPHCPPFTCYICQSSHQLQIFGARANQILILFFSFSSPGYKQDRHAEKIIRQITCTLELALGFFPELCPKLDLHLIFLPELRSLIRKSNRTLILGIGIPYGNPNPQIKFVPAFTSLILQQTISKSRCLSDTYSLCRPLNYCNDKLFLITTGRWAVISRWKCYNLQRPGETTVAQFVG